MVRLVGKQLAAAAADGSATTDGAAFRVCITAESRSRAFPSDRRWRWGTRSCSVDVLHGSSSTVDDCKVGGLAVVKATTYTESRECRRPATSTKEWTADRVWPSLLTIWLPQFGCIWTLYRPTSGTVRSRGSIWIEVVSYEHDRVIGRWALCGATVTDLPLVSDGVFCTHTHMRPSYLVPTV